MFQKKFERSELLQLFHSPKLPRLESTDPKRITHAKVHVEVGETREAYNYQIPEVASDREAFSLVCIIDYLY